MAIFNSYVKLPEGNCLFKNYAPKRNRGTNTIPNWRFMALGLTHEILASSKYHHTVEYFQFTVFSLAQFKANMSNTGSMHIHASKNS